MVATEGEARVSTVVLGDDGSVTRLYEFGPEIAPADERALLELAGGARRRARRVGRGHRGGAAGRLARLLRRPRRAPPGPPATGCWSTPTGEQLAGALAERPDLVKVNLAEACSAVGAPEAHCDDEQEAAPEALVAEGLELCRRLVDAGRDRRRPDAGRRRGRGRRWTAPSGASRTRQVRAVNPVGSGDCFAAGLTLALQRGEGTAAALRLAGGRRRRQRRLAVQRRRRPGAGGGAGGRGLRRPARAPRFRRPPAGRRPPHPLH